MSARDTMSEAAFHQMMAVGLKQAKADDSFDFQKVFDELEAGLEEENHLTTEKP